MKRLSLSLSLALLCVAPPVAAQPGGVAERIVAVVGEKPILLSELRQRAAPFLLQVKASVPTGAQRASAESQVYKELLRKMMDEELIERAAQQAKIAVTKEEIEQALARVAASNNLSVPGLFAAALSRGLSEDDYRAELTRQLLEGKMLLPYAQKHASFTQAELRARYDQAVQEERRALPYRASSIVLLGDKKLPLAAKILERARKGEDFAALARQYSEEKKDKSKSSQNAPLTAPGTWARSPVEEDALFKLDPGQVSDVVRIGDKIVILKLEERAPSRFNGLVGAAVEINNLLVYERIGAAREGWIKGLRAGVYAEESL